jgi:hypothetical protein
MYLHNKKQRYSKLLSSAHGYCVVCEIDEVLVKGRWHRAERRTRKHTLLSSTTFVIIQSSSVQAHASILQ